MLFFVHATATGQSVTGRVVDARTGAPLHSVTVMLANTTLGTISNRAGRFEIQTRKPGQYLVRISRVGYEPFEGLANTDQPLPEVALKPVFLQLNKGVIVTAQRYETSAFSRPEAVSVLAEKELSQRAPRSTPEALMGLPGVWVQKTNHGGGSPFIRGLTGQQTLLLIDGIRLNNATFRSGPNQYLNTVDPQSLAQLEVLRGPDRCRMAAMRWAGCCTCAPKHPALPTACS